ncbi:MAG: 16S rRNA (cytidine(1402)-2'-O)-methyltransferase [Solirubrobacteraceae bacterium]
MERNRSPAGGVIVCPTPIGNLEDVTLRALNVLREADVIACEDTRRTGQLLVHHGLRTERTRLVSFHEHNERERAGKLVSEAGSGALVVLVSDAGTPLLCDPGFALIDAARHAGVPVNVLPGASAVLVALVASGLPASRFCFAGFLPRARAELRRCLEGNEATLVAYESPRRLAATLALLAELHPQRELAVCRELTKLHEQVHRGCAAELAELFAASPPRGEIVIVLAPAPARTAERQRALSALRELIDAGARPRPAARAVARLVGGSANELYELAMQDADSLRSQ